MKEFGVPEYKQHNDGDAMMIVDGKKHRYGGTIPWTTTDPDPGVQLPADYQFQPGDQGQMTFPGGVTLVTLGDQTLTVTDPASGITGSTSVTIVPPN